MLKRWNFLKTGFYEGIKVGLAHLNDELHTTRQIVTDPKVGNTHLNDEMHTIKQLLTDISAQLEALRR